MVSAAQNARAAMVSDGLPVAIVGNTELPVMYRFAWSQERWFRSTTELSALVPMQHVPTMCPEPWYSKAEVFPVWGSVYVKYPGLEGLAGLLNDWMPAAAKTWSVSASAATKARFV